jgi:site-specific DNA-methyltransferase (adenine-specific)
MGAVPYYVDESVTLFQGDCRDIMEGHLPDNSVDSIVTDPPYELGFMGKGWDGSGIAYNSEVWGERLPRVEARWSLVCFRWHPDLAPLGGGD